MNEQQVRRIAEAAFKSQFGAVEIVSVNVRLGFDHDEDPKVDVKIIYDGKYEQLNAPGLLRVQSEIVDKRYGGTLTTVLASPSCTSSPSPSSGVATRRRCSGLGQAPGSNGR